MLNRYLGQIGEDRTVVEFLLNRYGVGGNEYFEVPGTIMTTGAVKVSMPFQSGIIERVIFSNSSDFSMNNKSSFRFWMFQDTITSAVRGNAKAFTSSELDSFVGSFDIRNIGDVDPPNPDPWIYGIDIVPYANMLQKTVNIPFVINSENPTLNIVQEYIGDGTTLYEQSIHCYLIIKRD
jgi:hypothetical protein